MDGKHGVDVRYPQVRHVRFVTLQPAHGRGAARRPSPGARRPDDNRCMRVAILLFEGVDLLDVGGPYEVLLTASRLEVREGRQASFDVVTVSATDEPVVAYGGLTLGPSSTLAAAMGSAVVVVPGAIDIDAVAAREQVRRAVRSLAAGADVVTSVCTGAFLLGDAGLLDGLPFTTHWEDTAALVSRLGAPAPHGHTEPWVDTGSVVTAGGLSSGIAMALHLVDRLVGRDLAFRTARQLDYAWDPERGLTDLHPRS